MDDGGQGMKRGKGGHKREGNGEKTRDGEGIRRSSIEKEISL